MKTIGIVTDSRFKYGRSSRIGEELQRNVLAVFGDHVTVNTYFMDTLTQRASIKDDLIMLMAGSRGTQVRKFVSHPENIIIVKRTFVKEKIYPLFSIPEGTDVLVVNDNIETVLDSISSLYHIGVKHVNLIRLRRGKAIRRSTTQSLLRNGNLSLLRWSISTMSVTALLISRRCCRSAQFSISVMPQRDTDCTTTTWRSSAPTRALLKTTTTCFLVPRRWISSSSSRTMAYS
jgi:hypothetical protein